MHIADAFDDSWYLDNVSLQDRRESFWLGEPSRPSYGQDTAPRRARSLLARNVRLLRVRHGWSQEALAFEAGLDRSFIGAIERAERNVGLDNIEKLSSAFGIPLDVLLGPAERIFGE